MNLCKFKLKNKLYTLGIENTIYSVSQFIHKEHLIVFNVIIKLHIVELSHYTYIFLIFMYLKVRKTFN